jgi:hypothetical protein
MEEGLFKGQLIRRKEKESQTAPKLLFVWLPAPF